MAACQIEGVLAPATAYVYALAAVAFLQIDDVPVIVKA